tara:strand:- start:522 stop:1259 length:738 start_codon:yes stop_codon:yes gene_type:complete
MITACTPAEEPANNEVVDNKLPISNQITEIVENQPIPNTVEESQTYSEEVAELLEKSANLKSYEYVLSTSKRNQYENYEPGESYRAQVKDNKVKKSYSEAVKLNQNIYYSEIYLNNEEETALATCDLQTVLCDDNHLIVRSLRYPAAKMTLEPLQIIQSLPKNAEQIGSEKIDNRQAVILKYTNADGNKEKLFVDTYSGFPLKQESFIQEDDEEILLERNTFNLKGFNNIKNSEVTPPEDYETVE